MYNVHSKSFLSYRDYLITIILNQLWIQNCQKNEKKMVGAYTFDLLQNQNYQIFFVFKRASVMLIKKSRHGYIFLKKNRS